MNLQNYLAEKNVNYEVLSHDTTYDAQRMSHAVHMSGHHVAKTVLLKTPAGFAVAVLPAAKVVDLQLAGKALGVSAVELATEHELAQHCSDCELGALPPFGSQYQMQTLVDERLAEDEQIVFEGNNHNESIKMKFGDYSNLERPVFAKICDTEVTP
ncbi:MAG: aminoacyl-tRNA deacylase [Bythopirellula sp.]